MTDIERHNLARFATLVRGGYHPRCDITEYTANLLMQTARNCLGSLDAEAAAGYLVFCRLFMTSQAQAMDEIRRSPEVAAA